MDLAQRYELLRQIAFEYHLIDSVATKDKSLCHALLHPKEGYPSVTYEVIRHDAARRLFLGETLEGMEHAIATFCRWAFALGMDVQAVQEGRDGRLYRLLLWNGWDKKVAEAWARTRFDVMEAFEQWRSGNFETISRCGRWENEP